MIKLATRNFCPASLLLLLLASFQSAGAQSTPLAKQLEQKLAQKLGVATDEKEKTAVAETEKLVVEIVAASYPELKNAPFSVKTFHSRSDYFLARFSFPRFFTFRKIHYIIFVNPQVFEKNAPANGIRAIIAHELAHAAYYRRHNRFELFGLVNLESKSFTARFERGADLQAIKRGYGAGLGDYRAWLYQNIPAAKIAAKKRDYFSPAEIDLILEAIKQKPALIDFWIKNVPRTMMGIQSAIKNEY